MYISKSLSIKTFLLTTLLILAVFGITEGATAATWGLVYDGTVLPHDSSLGEDRWSIQGDPSLASIVEETNTLGHRILLLRNPSEQFAPGWSRSLLSQTEELTLEVRLKVLPDPLYQNEPPESFGTFGVTVFCGIAPNLVFSLNRLLASSRSFNVDFSNYHDIRLLGSVEKGCSLYIDGELRAVGICSALAPCAPSISFGDVGTRLLGIQPSTVKLPVDSYWDYIAYTTAGAFTPEELPSPSSPSPVGTTTLALNDVNVAEDAGAAIVTATMNSSSSSTVTADYITSDAFTTLETIVGRMHDLAITAADSTVDASARAYANDELYEIRKQWSQLTAELNIATDLPDISNLDISSQAGAVQAINTLENARTILTGLTSEHATTAGLDYTSVNGTLVWYPGETGDKTFVVPIMADSISEPDEIFTIELSNPTNAVISSLDSATYRGLISLEDMAGRMHDLAVTAADSTVDHDARQQANAELNELLEEWNVVLNTISEEIVADLPDTSNLDISTQAGAAQAINVLELVLEELATISAAHVEAGAYTAGIKAVTIVDSTSPSVVIRPDSINLGDISVGKQCEVTLEISNGGDADLDVTNITHNLDDDLEIDPSPPYEPPLTVAPDDTITATLTFTASIEGAINGTLSIESNDPTSPTEIDISAIADILVGDLSGDGTVSAYDASLILQFVVGLITEFPVESIMNSSPSDIEPRDYEISIPDVTVKPGEKVQVPIVVNDVKGLQAGGIVIKYNNLILKPTKVMAVGTLGSSYWEHSIKKDSEIRFAFASMKPIENGKELLMLEFKALPNTEGVTSPLAFDYVNLSESLSITQKDGSITVLPSHSLLLQNYPNPFNPETWIPFKLSNDANVVISIYDIQGQLVRNIGLGEVPAGVYVSKDKAIYWDGRNSSGEQISSGLYFYTLQDGSYSATKRMLILK